MAALPKPFMHEVIDGQVCISQNVKRFENTSKFRCFQPQNALVHDPLCDDFGPMNLAAVIQFIEMLEREISLSESAKIVYCVDPGPRAMTNAIFLLGAYMIIKDGLQSRKVMDRFSWMNDELVEPFRNATSPTSGFALTLKDCWEGLERGKLNGWIQPTAPSGMIDILEYTHYGDALNGDIHKIVPGKFLAFRGPVDLQGRDHQDLDGSRQFSPDYYANLFKDLGVSTVIQLNDPNDEYDPSPFTKQGIQHHHLAFRDCTVPTYAIVRSFFRIVDSAPGLIAVHCKPGLGRTGTLIALYMMRTCGFTPRQAIAWLRILRPGCVTGPRQQHDYLTSPAALRLISSLIDDPRRRRVASRILSPPGCCEHAPAIVRALHLRLPARVVGAADPPMWQVALRGTGRPRGGGGDGSHVAGAQESSLSPRDTRGARSAHSPAAAGEEAALYDLPPLYAPVCKPAAADVKPPAGRQRSTGWPLCCFPMPDIPVPDLRF